MSLLIEKFCLGPLETNCYVVCSDQDCWVVDPGLWPDPVLRFVADSARTCTQIVLTHGHGDHIGGVEQVRESFPDASILCPAGDAGMLTDPAANLSRSLGFDLISPPADVLIEPGQGLSCGLSQWQVLDTSGHTPGGVSFYCESAETVITGDALFAGSIGRTDLPGAETARLLENIKRNLLSLPEQTVVLPGHGPATTIGRQKRDNPFLQHSGGGLVD
ncbi:MAG: MBL fold metallo-hydrolase [Phycisphaerae bacterium]